MNKYGDSLHMFEREFSSKSKERAPRRSPANVEGATVKGQTTFTGQTATYRGGSDRSPTPLPWNIVEDSAPDGEFIGVFGRNGQSIVADCTDGSYEAKANAELIVAAVNAYQGSAVETVVAPLASPSSKSGRQANNDEHQEDYKAAIQGGIGADRMALGLACIPDKIKGDLDKYKALSAAVAELVEAAAQILPILGALCSNAAANSNSNLRALRIKRYERLRSALEVVKTDLAFSHNTESPKE